jgi:hypothetical protein
MLITLYVFVSFDHHQVCKNKNNKYTKFMMNYMMKMDPFLQRHKIEKSFKFLRVHVLVRKYICNENVVYLLFFLLLNA